jgi:hypothetical protein
MDIGESLFPRFPVGGKSVFRSEDAGHHIKKAIAPVKG